MPDRIVTWYEHVVQALSFAAIGVIVAIGQAKKAKEKDRGVILGRAICNGGLAAAAGAVLIWYPDAPLVAQFGIAAVLASLGTSGVEKLATKWIERGAQ